jgi:hypothetical protein
MHSPMLILRYPTSMLEENSSLSNVTKDLQLKWTLWAQRKWVREGDWEVPNKAVQVLKVLIFPWSLVCLTLTTDICALQRHTSSFNKTLFSYCVPLFLLISFSWWQNSVLITDTVARWPKVTTVPSHTQTIVHGYKRAILDPWLVHIFLG